MILKTKLIDPLEELKLDGFQKLNELLKINHHSPTSSSMPEGCLLYTSPSPRDVEESRMPSSA